mmetsp:Transcript_16160/g.27644  ORF Transcript_16160/g.27644 Transcript_16160/m.27644 type:complete len:226 (-) Transcript_16160:305-982(-)
MTLFVDHRRTAATLAPHLHLALATRTSVTRLSARVIASSARPTTHLPARRHRVGAHTSSRTTHCGNRLLYVVVVVVVVVVIVVAIVRVRCVCVSSIDAERHFATRTRFDQLRTAGTWRTRADVARQLATTAARQQVVAHRSARERRLGSERSARLVVVACWQWALVAPFVSWRRLVAATRLRSHGCATVTSSHIHNVTLATLATMTHFSTSMLTTTQWRITNVAT